MNATDVIALAPYLKEDIEFAKKRYDSLLRECTHVYNGGSSAIVVPEAIPQPDSVYDNEPKCTACGQLVPIEKVPK